jgi:hypothetical protein
MDLDLQSCFGLHLYSCTHWLRLRNPPPPHPHLGSYTRALLVSQDRRHLCVTPWPIASSRAVPKTEGVNCLGCQLLILYMYFERKKEGKQRYFLNNNNTVHRYRLLNCLKITLLRMLEHPLDSKYSSDLREVCAAL